MSNLTLLEAFLIGAAIVLSTFGIVATAIVAALRRSEARRMRHTPLGLFGDACWESVSVVENGRITGYRVRWSEPDRNGQYTYVGHFPPDGSGEPCFGYCEKLAEKHAARFNLERRDPKEFRVRGADE